MYDVCICLYWLYLYFLRQKLLVALIQTHSARYIQYIQNTSKINQKYNTNTYKYIKIHTLSTYEPTFFQAFFSVCILFVFVCIVSILIHVIYRYMSHTLELLCACMCMYCMYVHVFFSMHFLQSDFLGGKHVQGVAPPSHDNFFFAGWSMYVCVCIACMCMYHMYLHVFFRIHCASQIFLEENMSKVLLHTSHYLLIFAG